MKLSKNLVVALVAMLAVVVPTVLAVVAPPASAMTCPGTVTATEGARVTLTASPSLSGYGYSWSVPPALTGVVISGTYNEIVSFNVPAGVGPWNVLLIMGPTGAPDACKDACTITVIGVPLCDACPAIDPAVICKSTATTWSYVCSSAPASLFYEWWVSRDTAAPVRGNQATWGQRPTLATMDSMTYTPSPDWVGFNPVTESSPVAESWVTFVVRQDADHDGTPDTVIKWCTPVKITLYFDPTATMEATIG